MEKSSHQNLQGLCRLCLKYLNNSATTMTTMGYTSPLSDDVSKESAEFPKYLCSICLTKMREFDKFRKKALKSTKKLYTICKARENGGTPQSLDPPVFKQATHVVHKPEVIQPGQAMNVVHPESNVGTMLLHEILDIKPQVCYGATDAQFPSYFGVEVGHNKDGDGSSSSDDDLDDMANTSSNASDPGVPLVCPMCKETFSKQSTLDDHISVFHLGLNPTPFQCRICKKSFRNYNELCQHRQYQCTNTSSQKHRCPQCTQLFSNAGCLRRHVKVVHEGEKRFACSYCPLRFGTRIAQRNHERRHTGERPYICDVCRKGFTKKRNLEEHRRDHETP